MIGLFLDTAATRLGLKAERTDVNGALLILPFTVGPGQANDRA